MKTDPNVCMATKKEWWLSCILFFIWERFSFSNRWLLVVYVSFQLQLLTWLDPFETTLWNGLVFQGFPFNLVFIYTSNFFSLSKLFFNIVHGCYRNFSIHQLWRYQLKIRRWKSNPILRIILSSFPWKFWW